MSIYLNLDFICLNDNIANMLIYNKQEKYIIEEIQTAGS